VAAMFVNGSGQNGFLKMFSSDTAGSNESKFVSDWLISKNIFSSETAWHSRKHLWNVLGSFCPDPLTNMAATGNACFRLVDI
jgi:hypothetical protein